KHNRIVEDLEIPHFSSHCSEREPNGKGDCNSISAIPIIALGGSNPDQYIIPLIFLFIILAFVVILIIWYIYGRTFRPTKKKETFYPVYRNHSYGFPIRYTEEPKNRTTSYETLPYGYG
ncbi:hypothetical protein RhiirA1_542873, partial [Rhizophagus irregularis]